MKTPEAELPAHETYDVAGPKKALRTAAENPKLFRRLVEGSERRADDIFVSAMLEDRIKAEDVILDIGTGIGHVAKITEGRTMLLY